MAKTGVPATISSSPARVRSPSQARPSQSRSSGRVSRLPTSVGSVAATMV
ncbi:MAG TPA: hypothetical protein VIC62_16895 [Nakamurella sp.]